MPVTVLAVNTTASPMPRLCVAETVSVFDAMVCDEQVRSGSRMRRSVAFVSASDKRSICVT